METVIREPKRPDLQCSGCRKRKQIVFSNVRGLRYCEECKHKAPTREQFEAFKNEKTSRLYFDEEADKAKYKDKRGNNGEAVV